MRVLFVHLAFPAQFGRLALELRRRYGWECTFLVQNLSRCPTPTPDMLEGLALHRMPLPADFRTQEVTPWAQSYGRYLEVARAVYEGARALDLRPDLVVGHHGLGPTFLLRELYDCP